ncbi:anti-sigma factor [Bacteroides finegoldii]|uniref:anti-sigma factor n=1 Tax=Bacteroides finegoldii TaxID=338188 RepID=UPI0022E53049|nr:anti-sigma factor [Bacteroides finegoldii]
MKESLNKYFAGELTSDEKESFLMEVDKDKALKENFVDNQSLLVIIDWTFPRNKDNEEVIQQKLDEFMRKMEQRER